jgi:8-oxo-dGTP pyrophosphatase MutT (NUDIX family)
MSLREDTFERGDGTTGTFAVVSRSDFVVIVCEVDGALVMTEQYRYAAGQWSLELPQGGIEDGETVQEAALRELREETGWLATGAEVIGTRLFEAADWATQHFTVVRVEATGRGEKSLDHDELGARDELVPWSQLPDLVAAGRVIDAATLAAVALHLIGTERDET